MLLRRITDHIRTQNWFAVGIDLAVVVIGVFIGIQVSNWNDAVRTRSLEESYLARIAGELRSNIETFDAEARFAEESRAMLREFLEVLNNPSSTDSDLVHHATNYVSNGAFLSGFRPGQATFDELKSTGNLDIIQNEETREALVELHTQYADAIGTFEWNSNWVLRMEDAVYLGFDALRFDSRTSTLFSEQSTAATAQHIRENRDLLTRHAALHYWVKDRALEIFNEAIDLSTSVLERIE
jgi:hypothetical protein